MMLEHLPCTCMYACIIDTAMHVPKVAFNKLTENKRQALIYNI